LASGRSTATLTTSSIRLAASRTLTNVMACPQPRRDAELTVYPGVDHDSWTRTYDLSAGHDIYDWLLGFTVSDPAIAESTAPPAS
jgi:hypothetical protein